MSLDWGIIGTIIASGSAIGSAIWSLYTWRKFKQIRKEESMSNVDIDFKYELKRGDKDKFLYGNLSFHNIGRMNLVVVWLGIEFFPRSANLKLDYKKAIFSNQDDLKIEMSQPAPGKTLVDYDLIHDRFLKIDERKEEYPPYFDASSCYFLSGLQIASGETINESFCINYEGFGPIEVKISIETDKQVRKSYGEVGKWGEWSIDDKIYGEHAESERNKLIERYENKQQFEDKSESFIIFLD